jgi:hypothetical protein
MSPEYPSSVAVRFMLDADPSPGLLPRLLEAFAKRDLVPDRMWSHLGQALMHVEVAMESMPAGMVHLVEGNMRQVVGVRSLCRVEAEELRRAA